MNINPNLTEKVVEVSAKAKKAVAEKVGKGETFEESIAELPRMSLESVMPKSNIVRTAQKAPKKINVKKAIREFNDINDTETIKKICDQWRRTLERATEGFCSETIPPTKVYKAHRKFVKDLEKYGLFTQKAADLVTKSKDVDKASKIFEEFIEPCMIESQKTMHAIDNLPSVKSGYQLASGNAPAVKVSVKPNFKEEIKTLTSLNDASRLITKLEKAKTDGTISAEEFNHFNEIIGQQLEDIVSGKVKPVMPEIAQGIKTAASDSAVDTKSLSHEIDKLLAVDLASGKVGDISNKLYELSGTNKEAYLELSEKFNTKLMELSS